MKRCRTIIERNDHIDWVGGVGPDKIGENYMSARFFASMTTGENFGHAIIEALAHGCPVIISDQTPWRDIERDGAGWVVPINDAEKWKATLERAANLNAEEYEQMSQNAVAYVKRKFDTKQLRQQYLDMFRGEN